MVLKNRATSQLALSTSEDAVAKGKVHCSSLDKSQREALGLDSLYVSVSFSVMRIIMPAITAV